MALHFHSNRSAPWCKASFFRLRRLSFFLPRCGALLSSPWSFLLCGDASWLQLWFSCSFTFPVIFVEYYSKKIFFTARCTNERNRISDRHTYPERSIWTAKCLKSPTAVIPIFIVRDFLKQSAQNFQNHQKPCVSILTKCRRKSNFKINFKIF